MTPPRDPAPGPGRPADADAPSAAKLATELRACLGPLVRRLRQVRPDDELTLSQASVLARLDREGPATASELAAGERIRPQSMGAIVAALREHGLIARTPDPADGRRVVVSLTEAGRARLRGTRQERDRRLARAVDEELTAAERALLAGAVPLLERITGRL
ncbi:MarR family winged helix-turn-helix transcriptional regulator [Kitasatospora sp. LaBMicrA B282]|uniref:MarR family winged helix-turn-helix transcriptional regulator n=1 Tax=Kitasatospora sp. LaBMicrA B282 TaxID=3420949 RepID=UPI003D126B37